MPADRVDGLRTLPDQQVAGTEHQGRSLLLLALHRNKAHVRTLRCLADRLGIGNIILLPLHERLHIGRGDQPNIMANPHQFARPVVCAAASLQRHQASGLILKEPQHLPARYPAAEQLLTSRVCAMRLKHILCDIQAYRCNLTHERLLS